MRDVFSKPGFPTTFFPKKIFLNLYTYHNYNDEFEILHVYEKGKKLDFLEAMEINRVKKFPPGLLLNGQLELNSSPLLTEFCIIVQMYVYTDLSCVPTG